uniref:Uncharacterized protein n=1 Tax=Glossina austeni TaxID=7395 RepID=A0A1A9VDD6_GLOAU
MYRQPSFAETKVLSTGKASTPYKHFTNSTYLSRGLSLNRLQSIRKSKSLTSENKNQLLSQSNCCLHKPTNEEKLYQRSQTCSSFTTSLTKTINKELSNVNSDLKQSCNSKSITSFSATYLEVENAGTRREFVKKFNKALPQRGVSIKKHSKPGTNKVNLSIVLSQDFPLNTENDYLSSDAEDNDEAGAIQIEDGRTNEKTYNAKTCKTEDTSTRISSETNRNLFSSRKVFYHSSRLNLISTNHASSTVGASNILNAGSLLTMRPPLLRATSAPVRCRHDSSNGTFLANKRKSRRRTTNLVSEAKSEESTLVTKVQKSSNNNKRMLARAHSLTSEVITLVSLISPENSDSEKEDTSIIVGRRAPSLKKTGKSVSFQETNLNRFHSKECSHMFRRGSVASLAERSRANRPPTAPPVSIFFQHSHNSAEDSAVEVAVSIPNESVIDSSCTTKSLEVFTYPDHVRSHKGRECWKLFLKMSSSGVNITYDTIMRGLLTPTEFRQQQKQRELEEAKKFKENQATNQANNFSLQDDLKK